LQQTVQRDAKDNINKVGWLKNTVERGTRQEATQKIQDLENDLIKITEKTNQMPNEIKKFETYLDQRFTHLDANIKATQNDLKKTQNDLKATQNDLKTTQTELTELKSSLETDQVTHNFEKALAKHIYPPGTPKVHGPTFSILMKWLDENRETEKGRIANDKWKLLKDEFGWSEEHTQLLSTMVSRRMKIQDPEFRIPAAPAGCVEFTLLEKKRAEVIPQITNRIYELLKLN
jgi:DNA repair exonuclease SbcCD ATPase subunit